MRAGFSAARKRARSLSMALALAVSLTGCAGLAPRQAPAEGGAQAILSGVTDYHGRFAVHYVDGNGADRNVYGNFDLHQDSAQTTLDLINPLGQTMARVTVLPSGATLELPGKAPQSAPAVEALMQHAIGFPLPLAGLRYWLQPATSPDAPAQVQRDPDSGRLTQIRQDGWTIDYLAYSPAEPTVATAAAASAASASAIAPVTLKRVNLSRSDPTLEVKLVIDH